MTSLISASAVFFLLHRLVSGGPLRAPLTRMIGERLYRALFGLASVACLVWLWLAYRALNGPEAATGPDVARMHAITVGAVQVLAILLIVSGLSTRSPTITGMGDAANEPEIARGILRITRHPFLWGVTLFAFGHLSTALTAPGLVFYGTLAGLALTGTLSIDRKRARAGLPGWAHFASATSNIPFAAVLQGKQSVRWAEIGGWRILIGLSLAGLLIWAHPYMAGRAVFPG